MDSACSRLWESSSFCVSSLNSHPWVTVIDICIALTSGRPTTYNRSVNDAFQLLSSFTTFCVAILAPLTPGYLAPLKPSSSPKTFLLTESQVQDMNSPAGLLGTHKAAVGCSQESQKLERNVTLAKAETKGVSVGQLRPPHINDLPYRLVPGSYRCEQTSLLKDQGSASQMWLPKPVTPAPGRPRLED